MIQYSTLAAAVFIAPPSYATVLFEVQMHFASGPISLSAGQAASTCAVNPDSETVPVLVALLTADNSVLLASRQAILQPGAGVCLNYTRPPTPNNISQSQNVYAVVVPRGSLDANGRIVQVSPGPGGCIVASLQIQLPIFNNVPGQTILYAQMIKHDHTDDQYQ
jgi:hypothetical protein